eukprot:scaffold262939_cov19-Tisochrysis_lutea.AAC.2
MHREVLGCVDVSLHTVKTVIMPSPKVKSFSESPSPVTKMDGNKYKYGKYDLVKPWSVAEMRLHYENNKPFKKAMSLVREIEISHWGNIYVEETYEVVSVSFP